MIVDANGYPAKNDAVNRFVKQVLEISLEKRIGSGPDLEQELELTPGGESTVEVVFQDKNEKPMVRFTIGKPFDEATLLRVADAYQGVTDWHTRRPEVPR